MKVQVPSPLSSAEGPELGSQYHQGPVIFTFSAASQTSTFIFKLEVVTGQAVHFP